MEVEKLLREPEIIALRLTTELPRYRRAPPHALPRLLLEHQRIVW